MSTAYITGMHSHHRELHNIICFDARKGLQRQGPVYRSTDKNIRTTKKETNGGGGGARKKVKDMRAGIHPQLVPNTFPASGAGVQTQSNNTNGRINYRHGNAIH